MSSSFPFPFPWKTAEPTHPTCASASLFKLQILTPLKTKNDTLVDINERTVTKSYTKEDADLEFATIPSLVIVLLLQSYGRDIGRKVFSPVQFAST